MPGLKKKRNRDALSPNWREARQLEKSSKAQAYLQGSLSKGVQTSPERKRQRLKAVAAGNASQSSSSSASFSSPLPTLVKDPDSKQKDGFYEHRRYAICYLWQLFGSPSEDEWEEIGIVKEIMHRLGIESDKKMSVLQVMRDSAAAEFGGIAYDSRGGMRRRGRKALIEEHDDVAKQLYQLLGAGVSIPQATMIINIKRRAQEEECISCSALWYMD